jgi:predicted nucleotidyltransferase
MNDLKTVKSILSKHYDISENPTYIFGSRANGTHRPDSDLDILIDDSNIKPETVSLISEEFEECDILYKVDIVLKSRIDIEFYKKVESQLKPL